MIQNQPKRPPGRKRIRRIQNQPKRPPGPEGVERKEARPKRSVKLRSQFGSADK